LNWSEAKTEKGCSRNRRAYHNHFQFQLIISCAAANYIYAPAHAADSLRARELSAGNLQPRWRLQESGSRNRI